MKAPANNPPCASSLEAAALAIVAKPASDTLSMADTVSPPKTKHWSLSFGHEAARAALAKPAVPARTLRLIQAAARGGSEARGQEGPAIPKRRDGTRLQGSPGKGGFSPWADIFGGRNRL